MYKRQVINNSQLACGVFLDFSKAFDTVDQKILLRKLISYGIQGLAYGWFLSCLLQRKQCVRIENVLSGEEEVRRSVSQGSVLGPICLLFI